MVVGNTFYVTECYNEVKFQLLLENHLSKRKGINLSDELITQCLAGYLECKNNPAFCKETSKMENLLQSMGIVYSDHRNYTSSEVKGSPIDAVKVFSTLMISR